MDASQSLGRRQNAAHLDSTTIVEASCSLSLRGTSGERAGERGTFHRIGAANWNPLSLTLSPLLCRGERESTSGMVVLDAPTDRRTSRRTWDQHHPETDIASLALRVEVATRRPAFPSLAAPT